MEATVTLFMQDRGFGFARPDDGGEELWLHVSNLVNNADKPKLIKNARVSCDVGTPEETGKKRPALNIRILDVAAAAATPLPPSPTAAAVSSPTTATAPTIPKLRMHDAAISVAIEFSLPRSTRLQVTIRTNQVDMYLCLRVRRGEEQEKWEERGERTTDAGGIATFIIPITPEEEHLDVQAVIPLADAEGNRVGEKIWEATWVRDPQPVAKPAAEAHKVEATTQELAPAPAPDKRGPKAEFASVELAGESHLIVTVHVNWGGAIVRLKRDGRWHDQLGANLDGAGNAVFLVEVPAGSDVALLEAFVAEDTVPFRHIWRRPQPATPAESAVAADEAETLDVLPECETEPTPAPEPAPPPEPKLEVTLLFRQGPVYTFRIATAPNPAVTVESACLMRARKSGYPGWTADGRKQVVDSDEGGTLDLEVQLVTPGDRGMVKFLANDLEHPEYLTNDEPVTPAAKEQT